MIESLAKIENLEKDVSVGAFFIVLLIRECFKKQIRESKSQCIASVFFKTTPNQCCIKEHSFFEYTN